MEGSGLMFAGRVGAPHGLAGAFRVVQATPELLIDGGLVSIDGRSYAINRRAGHDRGVILGVVGVDNRDGALALRGRDLMVSRTLAPPLGEDEWWAEELEGCRVIDAGREIGVVTRLSALPSCEVLEVRRPDVTSPLLVPLVGDAVRSVDVVAKVIDVDLGFLGET